MISHLVFIRLPTTSCRCSEALLSYLASRGSQSPGSTLNLLSTYFPIHELLKHLHPSALVARQCCVDHKATSTSQPLHLEALVIDQNTSCLQRKWLDGDSDLVDHRLEAAFVDRNRTQAATIAQATIVKIFLQSANCKGIIRKRRLGAHIQPVFSIRFVQALFSWRTS